METWNTQQKEARKAQDNQISNTDNNRRSINMCSSNCPQRQGGCAYFPCQLFLWGGGAGGMGLHVFHGSFFSGGGGCFKAPMGEGMEGITRAKGWVGQVAGLTIVGGFSHWGRLMWVTDKGGV